MRRSRSPTAAALLLVVAVPLAVPREASADPTASSCVGADTAAQAERRGEHLRAAREHLRSCAVPACPKLVRDDCAQRLDEVNSALPTVVFAAKDAAGDDVSAVRVTMDGDLVAAELSGAPLEVDPGPHTFLFETPGAAPVERKLIAREGERGRQERVTFPGLHAATPGAAPVASGVAPGTSSSWGAQRSAAIAVGGVGVGGVVAGAILGALSFSSWSASQSACGAVHCVDRPRALSDHDAAVTFATLSDVTFLAGGVLATGGLALFLTAPARAPATAPPASAFVRVAPAAGPGGAGVRLEGGF